MYNAASIKTSLIGLIGWRQNPDPNGEQLTDMLTTSSGLYYNDQHPYLTIDNLLSIAHDDSRYTYTAWDSGTTYAIGDIVVNNSINYIATAISTNQEPPDASYWTIYSPFTAWLKEKTEAGILSATEAWLYGKSSLRTANNLLERRQLFENTANTLSKQQDTSKSVGLEITPYRSRSLDLKIQSIGLQFDTNQSITIQLFSSDTVAAVQSETVAYTASGGVQWVEVNWELSGAGSYWIVYDQNDITGQAINAVYDYNFNREGYNQFPAGKYFQVSGFETVVNTTTLWDVSQNAHTLGTNYGLNLRLTVECDYTDFILEQKNLFKTIIAKKVAMDLLRELALNPNSRINRNQSNVSVNQLLYEIDGDTQGRPGGIKHEYEQALSAIQFDTTNIDPICLPCRKRGVKYKSVF